MPSSDDNQKKMTEIDAIYADYISEIGRLRDEQHRVATEFMTKLEEKKIENLRTILNLTSTSEK